MLFDRQTIGILSISGIDGNITSGLYNAVKSTPVYHQVFDYRKTFGAPGFYHNGITIFVSAHVQLAGSCFVPGAMRLAIDVHGASTADTFPTIVAESTGALSCVNQLLLQTAKHF